MPKKECVAMILAGGQGSRLGLLTKKLAKPAVPFGGKYRIIDFTLSNCANSGIETVGVLTQYQPFTLHSYIGIGNYWDLDRLSGGVYVLPPYMGESGGEWYKGTANAVYQNRSFIAQFDPDYVLVLSGDHIYKMDYGRMLEYHIAKRADATIAVIEVPWQDANRFGIMNTGSDGRIVEFEEKPMQPKNNLASMGVYVFNWKVLKRFLEEDEADELSSHDFGKNVIPKLLNTGQELYAYSFSGYWKDVGTIDSLWEANMDLLEPKPELNLYDPQWPIYSVNTIQPPQYLGITAQVKRSLVSSGCLLYGSIEHSVIFPGVYIGEGAEIKDSVIMPGARINKGVKVAKAIIGESVIIEDYSEVGSFSGEITVVGDKARIPKYTQININYSDVKRQVV